VCDGAVCGEGPGCGTLHRATGGLPPLNGGQRGTEWWTEGNIDRCAKRRQGEVLWPNACTGTLGSEKRQTCPCSQHIWASVVCTLPPCLSYIMCYFLLTHPARTPFSSVSVSSSSSSWFSASPPQRLGALLHVGGVEFSVQRQPAHLDHLHRYTVETKL
jgi:hypothetical protein